MLAYLNNNVWTQWTGQQVGTTYYPLTIEDLWTPAQLIAVGLYPVTPFVIPSGQQISGPAGYALNGTLGSPTATVTQTYPTTAIVVPQVTVATPAQARLALFNTPNPNVATPPGAANTPTGPTMLDVVNAYITSQATANPSLNIWWEYAGVILMSDPHLQTTATALGLTATQLNALFTLAATFSG